MKFAPRVYQNFFISITQLGGAAQIIFCHMAIPNGAQLTPGHKSPGVRLILNGA